MKKLLGIIVLGLLWCNTVLSDITNGDLTTSWGYKSNSEQIEIVAYNANASQSLTITKIQIWYTSCDNIDNYGPNKVYDIDRTVQPRSDKRIYKSAIIKHSGEMCSRISHSMNVSSSNKSITSKKKKKKKKTEENSSNLGVVALLVVAVFIAIWANGNSSPEKKSKSKKPTYRPTNNEEDNNSQLENASKPKIKVQKEDKTIAKFYNDYKSIDFTDSKSIMSKANKKQTETLVNIIMPCLQSLADKYPKDTQVVMILIKLVEDNLVSEEKFIEVQKNLKEMKNIGETVGLNQKLMTALHIMVG